jgi:hypothetical protein
MNRLVFTVQTVCVCVCVCSRNWIFCVLFWWTAVDMGWAVSQVASCQRLTGLIPGHYGPSGTVTVPLPAPQCAPVRAIPTMLNARSCLLLLLLSEVQRSKAWEPSNKAKLCLISEEHWTEQ